MGITINTGLSHVTRHRRLSTRLEEETYVCMFNGSQFKLCEFLFLANFLTGKCIDGRLFVREMASF